MSPEIVKLLLQGVEETIFMVAVSGIIATVIGIPLGILLVTTDKGHILENAPINRVFGTIVNIIRSVPFIILMVAIIPFTKLVAGTSIGTLAACVPLTICRHSLPQPVWSKRPYETSTTVSLRRSIHGATPFQIIRKVLLPEALPTIINNITVLIVSLIGSSAMAGAVGGGGLGDIAIRYGYQRFRTDVMLATIVILIIGVNAIQAFGDFLSRKTNKTLSFDIKHK